MVANKLEYKAVGIVGVPPVGIISSLNEAEVIIHDLDAKLVPNSIDGVTPYLPKVYCAILRTVVLNAIHLDLDAIYIDIGAGKCDAARHVATILAENLSIPVIETVNDDKDDFGIPVSQSYMDLTEKFLLITEKVKRVESTKSDLQTCIPEAGFWGVPPRDFSILKPFPASTHIYGWTRCMENKTPANAELEAYSNKSVPTVFFAQSFCAKTALAKFLADHHPRSIFLDVDFHTSRSARTKVQAFLELAGVLT